MYVEIPTLLKFIIEPIKIQDNGTQKPINTISSSYWLFLVYYILLKSILVQTIYAVFLFVVSNTAKITANTTAPTASPINPLDVIPAARKPTAQGIHTVKA